MDTPIVFDLKYEGLEDIAWFLRVKDGRIEWYITTNGV